MQLVYINEISAGIFGQDKETIVNLQPVHLDVENVEHIIKDLATQNSKV